MHFALYRVSDLLETRDLLHDLYFADKQVLVFRFARKSLCRVAVGMAGVRNSSALLHMQQIPAEELKNLLSIPYTEIMRLVISRDSQSRMTLELQLSKKRTMLFALDGNQFAVATRELPKIAELQKNLWIKV